MCAAPKCIPGRDWKAACVMALCVLGCGNNGGPNPSGTLEATTIDVAPLVGGKVLHVGANEGERVQLGDTLLVIDTELVALERNRTVAQQRTITAQRNEAGARLQQAEQRMALANTTLDRTQRLQEKGSASRQQLDEAQTQRDVALGDVKAARDRLAVLDSQDRELAAVLAVFERRLHDGIVTAPVSGTVLLRSVEPGEVVGQGQRAFRLADLKTLELRVFLESSDLDRVALGQRLPVLVDALENKTIEGSVSWIASESEFTPKNVQTRDARAQLVYAIKLRVANPEGRLHIGMPAEVRLLNTKTD